MFSSSRRKIGVLLLTAVLLVPGAAAAEPSARADQQGTRTPWDFLARLWDTGVVALWGENGCSVEPFGRCDATNANPAPTDLDNGCGMDPFGGCGHGG